MNKKTISDIITNEDIKSWKVNEVITITGGTGSGKSHFIKTKLYDYAKEQKEKILFLIHRSNCKNQFENELKDKNDIIDVITYQHIEEMYKHNLEFDFSEYKYIVCDEMQYFCCDSAFNYYTDISFQKIINYNNSVKIFMSATGNHVKNLMKTFYKIKIIDYKIKFDYSYIKGIKYFNKNDTIISLIEECINKNQKAIVFIDSAKECYKYYTIFKDYSIFNCSKSNKNYYKYVDKEKINNMLINNKFEENILFTTCCLDAGVNIIDTDIKGIILDVKNTNTLIQCVGRRRINKKVKNDSFYLYIKNRNKYELSNMMKSLKKSAEKAICLQLSGIDVFLNKYKRNTSSSMIYDEINDEGNVIKKVNILMLSDNTDRQVEIESMQQSSYIKIINRVFGKKKSVILEEELNMNYLEKYLKSLIGIKLNKDKQKELINMIGLKDSLGRQQKSLSTLNPYLIENFDMQITSKQIRQENNKMRVWILSKNK